MGLWMIQSVRHEFDDAYSFAEICRQAEEEKEFPSRVDVNDDCFLAPDNMTKEIQGYCQRTGQEIPKTLGQLATVVYQSLAECYAQAFADVEKLTGKKYQAVHIVGGGSNAEYLNRLTARATGVPVYAGPTEATAIGNVAAQMITAGELAGLKEARACVFRSFPIEKYE